MINCSCSQRHFVLQATLMALFLIPSLIYSQVTWDGGAGTNNWMDADNWSTNTLPTSSQSVVLISVNVELPSNNSVELDHIELCCGSTLTVQSNATLSAKYISLQHANTEITNNGTLQATGGFDYGISLGGYTFLQNNGAIDIDNSGPDGGIKLFGANMVNDGSIDINTSNNNGDGIHTFNFAGVVTTVTNNGTVTIANTMGDGISGDGKFYNYGTVEITNVTYFQDLLLDGETGLEFQNYPGAMFKGDGKIDPTTFHWSGGDFTTENTGATPGIIEFFCLGNCTGADFTNADLTFHIEGMAGPGVADGHDQVQVNQTATLGGTFDVLFSNGYVPSAGDQFILMTYNAKTGPDPQINLPALPSGLGWSTSIGANEIETEVQSLLPVEIIEFSARLFEDYIELNWATGSETNNRGFYIEKSDNGINWELLDFVEGKGTVHDLSEYNYDDLDPYVGKNYFRLVQSDFDGTQNKSKTISINFNPKNISDEVNIYPNPIFRGSDLSIVFPNDEAEFDRVSIFNENGQLIFSEKSVSEDMRISTSSFTEGFYFIVFENREIRTSKRFVLKE